MNKVIEKVSKAMRKSLKEKNIRAALEVCLDFAVNNPTKMEGLSVLQRENEFVVFEQGSKRTVQYGHLLGGKESIFSIGGDHPATLTLALLMACARFRVDPQTTINSLQALAEGFDEFEKMMKNKEAA
jgi:hypothetical protein